MKLVHKKTNLFLFLAGCLCLAALWNYESLNHICTTSQQGMKPPENITLHRTPALVNQELLETLFRGSDPFAVVPSVDPDWTYPHTNWQPDFFSYIVNKHLLPNHGALTFYLEVGSFKAGSITLLASTLKKQYPAWENTSVVCVDPFTGDVNMWAWANSPPPFDTTHHFLDLGKNGRPRILDRFMANVVDQHHADMIVPIPATGIVGMKLMQRLYKEHRISELPQIIYLDSAHEVDETLLELHVAWSTLQPCGILFGDDWSWEAVAHDVTVFAKAEALTPLILAGNQGPVQMKLEQPYPGLVVFHKKGQWFLQKPRLNKTETCAVNTTAWWNY
jgi:hypothetical protein